MKKALILLLAFMGIIAGGLALVFKNFESIMEKWEMNLEEDIDQE